MQRRSAMSYKRLRGRRRERPAGLRINWLLRSGQVRLVSSATAISGLEIDPQRTAAEAQVADRMRRKMTARGGVAARAYPSPARANCPAGLAAGQRARSLPRRRGAPCAEFAAAIENLAGKAQQVGTFEKSPAWPAAPPSSQAFSSCTSP